MTTDVVTVVKDGLAKAIAQKRSDLGISQVSFSSMAGVAQARCSEIERGKLDKFTVDYLIRIAQAVGLGVSAVVDTPVKEGRKSVKVAVTVQT